MWRSWRLGRRAKRTFGLIAVAGVGSIAASYHADQIPDKTLLVLDFSKTNVTEVPHTPPFFEAARGGSKTTPFYQLIGAINSAASDPKVEGIVVKLGVQEGPVGLAQAQEIRVALEKMKANGKTTYALSDTYGEFRNGTVPYYIASGCSNISVQSTGDVSITGFRAEQPFVRDLLDKVGIEPEVEKRHEYKNALDMFAEKTWTKGHLESTKRIFESLYDQVAADIASARGLAADRMQTLFDTAPHCAADAKEGGLVDEVKYPDEVMRSLRGDDSKEDEQRKTMSVAQYLKKTGGYSGAPRRWWKFWERHADQDSVAIVFATGAIARGKENPRPFQPPSGSYTAAEGLKKARLDDKVKAVVLRVDSPGGSVVASDTILREVSLLQKEGKKVIVSMGNVAASGGYFISMNADTIIADRATITGSIGVIGGKFILKGLHEKLGINVETLDSGKASGIFSTVKKTSPEHREQLSNNITRIYEDFIERVGKGRGMTRDQVHEVARGRVWTGQDALERGLVDKIGGVADAIDEARKAVGNDSATVKVFPAPKPWYAKLKRNEEENEEARKAAVLADVAWPLAGMVQSIAPGSPAGDLLASIAVGAESISIASTMGPTALYCPVAARFTK